ncbi:MAG TPA: 4'-phosphopantetheinyl transferase superfamily protein, partial [Hyphomicrobiales bacterium]|nr:4'-phosphopantetheinyl transferase superfamily protein [Hyphomicrobiales bacterium]
VGVDVEHALREVAAEALTARFFAPEELQALQSLPEADRNEYFFRLWTLKEAYVKALGLGLRIPLDSFVFDLDDAQIHCERREAGAPPLRFCSLAVAPHFRVGVAVASTLEPVINCFRGLPFEGFVRQT